ncbi:MAG: hypothetical protein AAFP20_24855, partial [Cyanobacteria bacterium J06614_10]
TAYNADRWVVQNRRKKYVAFLGAINQPKKMQRINKLLSKISSWKEKAKARSQEISRLRRKVKDLRSSRDHWKAKYQSLRREMAAEQSGHGAEILPGPRPAGHHYSIGVIRFCLWLRQQGNCSLETCCQLVGHLLCEIGSSNRRPCRSSIRDWELKYAHHALFETQYDPEEEWVLIPDESMCVGQECILLILGVPLSRYRFGQALCFTDVEVLFVGVARSWKAAQIQVQFQALQDKGIRIAYVVSDGGWALGKAIRDSQLERIADCTHAVSNLIEKRYKKQPLFEAYSKACADWKRKVSMSKTAPYMPPRQRSKGRFLNLDPIAKWGRQIRQLLEEKTAWLVPDLDQQLEWMQPYQSLIEEINVVSQTKQNLFRLLKHHGFSPQTYQKARALIDEDQPTDWFAKGLEAYLELLTQQAPQYDRRICCSDIVESFFGKYKNRYPAHPARGLSQSALTIALYPQHFSQERILRAMEQTTLQKLQQWRDKHMPENIASKRKKLFKNVA